ncbi:MAG: hypothetical protein K2X93_14400 [Candidatus Obscuribacterales bacterium]|nr:hypothetical protein [Candidatus Obscuribacterales bacterium]
MTKTNSDNDGGTEGASQDQGSPDKTRPDNTGKQQRKVEQNPLNLLLAMATDDNVETGEGQEVKVDDARSAPDKVLLTKSEMTKYEEYKRQWSNMLKHPQEAFDALERRERQIIQAAKTHDWDALDKLKVEVDSDLERMTYIFGGLTSGFQTGESGD